MQTLSLKILPLGTQVLFFLPHWYLIFVLQIKREIDIDAMVAFDLNIYKYEVLTNVSIFALYLVLFILLFPC